MHVKKKHQIKYKCLSVLVVTECKPHTYVSLLPGGSGDCLLGFPATFVSDFSECKKGWVSFTDGFHLKDEV